MPDREARRRTFLGAAAAIGQRLRETACFDQQGRMCNWVGRQDMVDPVLARYSVRAAALGPELYGGSAGVALFLGELYRQTGDREAMRVARAALRRSLHYMRHHPTGASPLSFYAGHLGLAHVACRLADLDPRDGPEPGALGWLVPEILGGLGAPHTMDLISGNAGAIGPLLALARRPGLDGLAEAAIACGDELCAAAEWRGDGCTWDPARLSGESLKAPPITGLSHGLSGVALGLLALYERTGRRRYLAAARGALASEDSLYSAAEGNWVDTRFPHAAEDGVLRGTFQAGWCHGGPGIALARMHAARLDTERSEGHRAMAEAGVRAARAAIERDLQRPGHDATLCHGIAGLSEVLLTHGALFGAGGRGAGEGTVERTAQRTAQGSARETGEDAAQGTAEGTALDLVRRHGEAGDWPSGVNAGGPNPSLMIGLAGIGHHLLRLRDPVGVPSVLAVVP